MIGIVEYIPPSMQRGNLIVGDTMLVPGRNEVDIDKWREFAENPLVKQRIEQGILRVSFDQPTVIVADAPGNKKEKVSRVSPPVETKLDDKPISGTIEPIAPLMPSEPEKLPISKK